MSHRGEKPYKCEYWPQCQKQFAEKFRMIIHVRKTHNKCNNNVNNNINNHNINESVVKHQQMQTNLFDATTLTTITQICVT